MANLLRDFAEKMTDDTDFQKKFKADKGGTMTDFGLNAEEQKLILDENAKELRKRIGETWLPLRPWVTYHVR
ncbi:MAG: hypothetical protein JKY60_01025 [Kordiimonadaceae bacterium]|nr:hypothetical protein [Kordiimonadaceae bacterium]